MRTGCGNSCVERPFQHLYPLELSYDRRLPTPVRMNPKVAPFRPRRDAAVTARLRLQEITQDGELFFTTFVFYVGDFRLITYLYRLYFERHISPPDVWGECVEN